MLVRLTRDGMWWIGDNQYPPHVVGTIAPEGISHFDADLSTLVARAFSVVNGEVNQVDPHECLAVARDVAARADSIDAALRAEINAEREALAVAMAAAEAAIPPKDRRATRYKAEADPLLLAAIGYQVEIDAGAAVEAKRDKAKADYLAKKAQIRAEIPD